MKLYHYTKKNIVSDIIKEGLKASSNYKSLHTELRKNVVYAWLSPEHDVMGYMDNEEYELLELEVDESRCYVTNMDFISAAYVNSTLKNKVGDELALLMVNLYEQSAIIPSKYTLGDFRTPEVLIQGDIHPSDIRIVNKSKKINKNTLIYSERLKSHVLYQNKVFSLNEIKAWHLKLIAVHDDSNGVLGTFYDAGKNQYITVILASESSDSFINYFFNK